MTTKPKEFWINRHMNALNQIYDAEQSANGIHVIEYAAYDKLVAALKYYAKETEGARKVNVCEFYDSVNRMVVVGDGSLAREALKEVGEGV